MCVAAVVYGDVTSTVHFQYCSKYNSRVLSVGSCCSLLSMLLLLSLLLLLLLLLLPYVAVAVSRAVDSAVVAAGASTAAADATAVAMFITVADAAVTSEFSLVSGLSCMASFAASAFAN